jgi:hypothetical protein
LQEGFFSLASLVYRYTFIVMDSMNRRQYLAQKLQNIDLSSSFFSLESKQTYRTAITIAEKRIDFITTSSDLTERLRTYFSDYLDSSNLTCYSEIYIQPLPAPESLLDLWEDEDAEFHITGSMAIHRDFAGIEISESNVKTKKVFAYVSSVLDDAFHNLLRWHIPSLLIQDQSFLMHSAGLIREGLGYIFFGQSGAGKSTCSGIIQKSDSKVQLLGDDAVIIQMKEDGTAMIHSAPLGCGYSRVAPPRLSAPLAGMFSIRQSSINSVDPLTPSEGLASLLASAMVTTWDEFPLERIELAQKFSQTQPKIKALQFTKEPKFLDLIFKTNETGINL